MSESDTREWWIGLCGEQPYAFPVDFNMNPWRGRGDEVVRVVPRSRLEALEREVADLREEAMRSGMDAEAGRRIISELTARWASVNSSPHMSRVLECCYSVTEEALRHVGIRVLEDSFKQVHIWFEEWLQKDRENSMSSDERMMEAIANVERERRRREVPSAPI